MMRDVNDNELVSNLYSLTSIFNLNVVERQRACDIRSSILNRGMLGVQSSLFSGLKLDCVLRVRIQGWIWFLLDTRS